jgi:predicted RNase H-related nuclease YkuK (DUF458 family)
MEFKRFDGQKVDLVTYVGNYCHTHNNIQIMVSTDSQCEGGHTCFATIVAMYDCGDGEHGHGAHVISRTWKTRRYKKSEIFDRMMAETMASLDAAKLMRDSGIFVKYVDIDISPEEECGSNIAFSAAKGWVESEGFECRWKTLCPLSTSTADKVARK